MENEELNLDELETSAESSADNNLKIKNRIQQLSEKTKIAHQEKEAAEKAKAEAETKAQSFEKQTEFYKNFSQLSTKYPEAINYQDQILERVNKGYDQEEATIAVLGKEGKFGIQPASQTPPRPEGGSAITNVSDEGKTELNIDEKLIALREMERTGELQQALRAGINRS